MTDLKIGPAELGAPAFSINPPPKESEKQKTEPKKESGDAEEHKDGDDQTR